MASAAVQVSQLQPIPDDPAERLSLAAKAYVDLRKAEAEVTRIESILVQGEFAARRAGLSRADQFKAWTRKNDAENVLRACLGVQA